MAERRIELNEFQAKVLSRVWAQKREADAKWLEAMGLLGIDPAKIVSGHLEEDPHLKVTD